MSSNFQSVGYIWVSNLDQKAILDHLSESSKEIDAQKAVRVYERIKTLVDFVELKDKNYR